MPNPQPVPVQGGAPQGAQNTNPQQSIRDYFDNLGPMTKLAAGTIALIGAAYMLTGPFPRHFFYRNPTAQVQRVQGKQASGDEVQNTPYAINNKNEIRFIDGTVVSCDDVETASRAAIQYDLIIDNLPKTKTLYDQARSAKLSMYEAIKDGHISRQEMGLAPKPVEVKPAEAQYGKCTIHKTRGE
jgi:hypothetical protein